MNHIEMIASSLRNCSLNGGGGLRGRRASRHQHGHHAEEGSDDSEGVTVELNSEVALPYHWQQCLDIRTGQVYYVNWADGTRTTVDPRAPSRCFSTPSSTPPRSISSASSTSSFGSSYASPASSVGTVVAAAEWFSGATGGYGYEESDEEEERSSSSRSSAISSFSPTDESASSGSGSDNGHYNTPGGPAGHVLVAAGCRGCFMYFMVPKTAGLCPKCGSSGLVHLNNASYA